jgi:hypothetical protein
VIPDDVQALAVPVPAHRLFPAGQAAEVLVDLVDRLPLPGAAPAVTAGSPVSQASVRLW